MAPPTLVQGARMTRSGGAVPYGSRFGSSKKKSKTLRRSRRSVRRRKSKRSKKNKN